MPVMEEPLSRVAQYVHRIVFGEGPIPEKPLSRIEWLLAYAIVKGISGIKEGYYYNGQFYKDEEHTELLEPTEGGLYYDKTGKKLYLYDGTNYVEVGAGGASSWSDISNKPFEEIGNGFMVDGGVLTYDPEVISNVDYVDDNITDTMNFIIQERDAERAARVAGDELLQTQVTNLKNIGRFCAIWNAATGLPTSEPTVTPYVYKVGDYFRIGVAGYRVPTGSTYVQGAYDTVTEETGIGDVWYYDGTQWVKQASSGGGTVQDVQVNGVSILDGGVANVPVGADGALGVVKIQGSGLNINPTTGAVSISAASNSTIENKSSAYQPIVPTNLDKAIMEGLGNNALTWSDAYKAAARNVIGIKPETAFQCEMVDGTTKTLKLYAELT